MSQVRKTAPLCQAALADLAVRPLSGNYDLSHLCGFHREIFGDLYLWACEIRTVAIARTDMFCLPQHIESYAGEVFAALADERHLRGLDHDTFLELPSTAARTDGRSCRQS